MRAIGLKARNLSEAACRITFSRERSSRIVEHLRQRLRCCVAVKRRRCCPGLLLGNIVMKDSQSLIGRIVCHAGSPGSFDDARSRRGSLQPAGARLCRSSGRIIRSNTVQRKSAAAGHLRSSGRHACKNKISAPIVSGRDVSIDMLVCMSNADANDDHASQIAKSLLHFLVIQIASELIVLQRITNLAPDAASWNRRWERVPQLSVASGRN